LDHPASVSIEKEVSPPRLVKKVSMEAPISAVEILLKKIEH
jgi:hypothetical protein